VYIWQPKLGQSQLAKALTWYRYDLDAFFMLPRTDLARL